MARKAKAPKVKPAPVVPTVTRLPGGGVRLVLPYPVSANHLHFVGGGRKILSAAGRAYQQAVILAVRQAGSPKVPPGRLMAELIVCSPTRRRCDLPNVEKLPVDAAKLAEVLEDDCLIDDWHIVRGAVCPPGHVVLTITPLVSAIAQEETA